MLNEDYREILQCFVDERVKFLLVGAYALAAHGYPRATMDIDIWVMPDPENAKAVLEALRKFGAPLKDLIADDLLKNDTIFQIGVAPRRVDILTGLTGLEFTEAFARSEEVILDGISIRIPSKGDLILNKRATGRTKDLADAESLESIE
jgi:hypothetical protein